MRQHVGVFTANFSSNLLWQNCFAPKKSASCAEPRRVAAGILDVCQGGATMGLRETRLLRRMFSYARRPKGRALFACRQTHPCHSEPVTGADRVVRPYKLGMTALCAAGRCGHRPAVIRCGNAFSRRERQKNRAGGAPLALFPYGAGDRTRTGTLSPAVDFESTTSTNSITPADATRTLYRKRCGIAR